MGTKSEPIFMWPTRDTFRSKRLTWTEMRMENLFHENGNKSWGSNISVRQNIC